MKDNHSISLWQQAHDLFESYVDQPIDKSILEIKDDESIPKEIKILVLRLLKSLSNESTIIEEADLSYFDALIDAQIDLSNTNIDDYQLLIKIGEGGMAQVYKAERVNTTIQKFVAVKISTKQQKLSKALEDLFEKEQLTLSKLTHPNIISFHHGGISTNGIPYLVMEFIENAVNINHFCKNSNLDTNKIVKLVLPILDAIGYAHQQLIVHKDIKPSNILIDQHGKPYLVDFGISSITDQQHSSDIPHIYTPDYASPEQYLKKEITTSSDIFSFVAMLLDLLTGKKRTTSITEQQYDYQNDANDIEKILSESTLESDLKNILKKGLQEKVTNRYQSIQELKSDLQNWLMSEPVSATPKTSIYLFQKFIKRNPLSSILVTSLFGAIIFSLSAMFIQKNNAEIEANKSKQVTEFLIESIQSSDPDLTKGKEVSVKELLINAKYKIQETSFDDPLLTSSLQQNIGTALAKLGQYSEAEKLLLEAVSSDQNNIEAHISLAQLYLKQKLYEQSQQQYDLLNKKIEELNTQQIIQLNQIYAEQLTQQAEFDKAIVIINTAIKSKNINAKQNIESHLILADILDAKGDSQEAVDVLEKTLKISNKANGELSTSSTNISNLLADALTNINPIPYDKLFVIYQQTIEKQIKLYGEKHPLVAKTYLQYGFALKATDKIIESKEIAKKALSIAHQNFGENHILTAHINLLMSQLELLDNNIEKAITLLKQVVSVYENTYGVENFETNQVKTTLALYMLRAGQGKAATRILLSLYDSQKEQLGENHQATLYVVLNLNKAYNLSGDFEKAIDSGESALAISQQHLGEEFIITIGIQTVLAQSYLSVKNHKAAIQLFEPLLNMDLVSKNPAYDKKISLLLIQAYYENQQLDLSNNLIHNLQNKYYSNNNKTDDFYQDLQKYITKI